MKKVLALPEKKCLEGVREGEQVSSATVYSDNSWNLVRWRPASAISQTYYNLLRAQARLFNYKGMPVNYYILRLEQILKGPRLLKTVAENALRIFQLHIVRYHGKVVFLII